MLNSAKARAPRSERMPHDVQIIKHKPNEPEYLRALVGETKIPEPFTNRLIQ